MFFISHQFTYYNIMLVTFLSYHNTTYTNLAACIFNRLLVCMCHESIYFWLTNRIILSVYCNDLSPCVLTLTTNGWTSYLMSHLISHLKWQQICHRC